MIVLHQICGKTDHHLSGWLFSAVALNFLTSAFRAWPMAPLAEDMLNLLGALCLLLFVYLHGGHRYGWPRMLVFFGLAAAISWSTESLSIATGFPFGNYHYTDLLGDRIGNVPVLIIPAYFFHGYLAWTIGNIFVGNLGPGIQKKNILLAPFLASIVMVMWDVCFDPIMSTIDGKWIWEDGGAYFGVPISNFLGWILTVYLIFQTFAIYLYKSVKLVESVESVKDEEPKMKSAYWYLVPVMYAVQGLTYFLFPFFRVDHMEIYQPLSLVTVFTMFFIAILNVLFIYRWK